MEHEIKHVLTHHQRRHVARNIVKERVFKIQKLCDEKYEELLDDRKNRTLLAQ